MKYISVENISTILQIWKYGFCPHWELLGKRNWNLNFLHQVFQKQLQCILEKNTCICKNGHLYWGSSWASNLSSMKGKYGWGEHLSVKHWISVLSNRLKFNNTSYFWNSWSVKWKLSKSINILDAVRWIKCT